MTLVEAVNGAKQKHQDSYTYLFNCAYQKGYYVALKYVKNEEKAKDVLQDAFIKAYTNIDQLGDATKFESWFGRIVANTALNEIRKTTPLLFSQAESEMDGAVEDFIEDTRFYAQPEQAFEQEENARMIRAIVDDLSEEQRICVTMFYLQEWSVKEIAAFLNLSENTVKSRLNYGRQKIKNQVLSLEKSGTKLYGLAPIPFFLWLLRMEFASVSASPQLYQAAGHILYNAIQGAGTSIASAAGAATVTRGVAAAADANLSANTASPVAPVSAAANSNMAAKPLAAAATKAVAKTGMKLGVKIGIAVAGVAAATGVATATLVFTGVIGGAKKKVPTSGFADIYSATDAFLTGYVDVSGTRVNVIENGDYGQESLDGAFQAGYIGYEIYDFDKDDSDELLVVMSTGADNAYELQMYEFDAEPGSLVLAATKEGAHLDFLDTGENYVAYCERGEFVYILEQTKGMNWHVLEAFKRGAILSYYDGNNFVTEYSAYISANNSDRSFLENAQNSEYVEYMNAGYGICDAFGVERLADMVWYGLFMDLIPDSEVVAKVTEELNMTHYLFYANAMAVQGGIKNDFILASYVARSGEDSRNIKDDEENPLAVVAAYEQAVSEAEDTYMTSDSYKKFEFVYITDDNIPELIAVAESGYATVFSYANGKAFECVENPKENYENYWAGNYYSTSVNRYTPMSGCFIIYSDDEDYIYDKAYRIKDGTAKCELSAYMRFHWDTIYYLHGDVCDEDTYNAAFAPYGAVMVHEDGNYDKMEWSITWAAEVFGYCSACGA